MKAPVPDEPNFRPRPTGPFKRHFHATTSASRLPSADDRFHDRTDRLRAPPLPRKPRRRRSRPEGSPQKSGTPVDLGVNLAPGESLPVAGCRRLLVGRCQQSEPRPGRMQRDPGALGIGLGAGCGREQGGFVAGGSLPAVSLCLWWSGVSARGGRPPAMEGRRNGHGRRPRRSAQLSTPGLSLETCRLAGDSRA